MTATAFSSPRSVPTRDPAARGAADPTLRDALAELVGVGVRIARVAADVAEVQGRVAQVIASCLPETMDAGSAHEARMAGMAVDSVEAVLVTASPRVEAAGRAFDRVSRAVRRIVALVQRIDAGWVPRGGGADDRRAMARRQVARSVGQAIAAQSDAEAAERLFDDLGERLDDAGFDALLEQPVEVVIAAICRDLGLAWTAPDGAAGHDAETPPADDPPGGATWPDG